MVLTTCPQFDDTSFFIAWADWEQVRREKKCPITHTAAKLALKKLSAYTLPVAVQTLKNSAANSWQGIFPEKVKIEPQQSKPVSENTADDYSHDPTNV